MKNNNKTKLSKLWYLDGYSINHVNTSNNQYFVELYKDNSWLMNKINLPPLVVELMNREYQRGREDVRKELKNIFGIK